MTAAPTLTAPRDMRSRGAVMAGLERTRQRIAALQAEELRLLARADALAMAQTARLASSTAREREIPLRDIAAEAAAVLRRSDRGMQQRLHDAAVLVTGFAATLAALQAGRVDAAHVRVIQDAGARIADPDARRRFEQSALAVCERETPGRARPIVAVIAQRLDPVPADERHTDAAEERRVWVRDLDDGMAELGAVLPAILVHAAHDRLTTFARQVADTRRPQAGEAVPEDVDRRTMAQVRADVLADLLLTGHATGAVSNDALAGCAAITAQVQVVVPADALVPRGLLVPRDMLTRAGVTAPSTPVPAGSIHGADGGHGILPGLDHSPAELVGHGPIDSSAARRLAATADVWERIFLSPTTGAVMHVDTYRPSRVQRRHLDARDEHCRFPGCRTPSRRCDQDHTVDAARGGPTSLANLANLCRRHHTLKHAAAWTVEQVGRGVLRWTSPTGRVFPDVPRRVLEFAALASPHGPTPEARLGRTEPLETAPF
ncbi:HNH endonuclease signature motif containing protein [Microbacterium wangruii]|uniref:HNH endonuclease signature motif containing protein n=1 Tax=Microbacterium wangruii TaxID=3049073 RepID=UPI00256F564A|nr:HNH endonuclease signature motif containing protein [Microbacterium sp. zg-Y1211]MDL5486088.1 DUF222 domain-containing protein [Microbacterium sp. zg-Y1211]